MNGGPRPRVLIIGGGFGGLEAARALAKAPVDITLVDKTNHHLFQPLLYQVATAGLAAPAIAAPIRSLFRSQGNLTTLLAEVVQIDAPGQRVPLSDGSSLVFDHLIVAAGATHSYFGRDEWEQHAPGLKTLEDAFEIRRRVTYCIGSPKHQRPPLFIRITAIWPPSAITRRWLTSARRPGPSDFRAGGRGGFGYSRISIS